MAAAVNPDSAGGVSPPAESRFDAPDTSQPATPKMNHDFVFPAQLHALSPTSPRSPGRRRALSPIQVGDESKSPDDDSQGRAALPVFSFNPGAMLPPNPDESPMLSPPTSPFSSKPSPSSSKPPRHGHRRGGSEFVGGSIRDGNSIAVMSTSPTKENGFASAGLQPPRRGHRRGVSGAISTNDLPILQPPLSSWSMPKGNSAPNSPTNFDQGVMATIPMLDGANMISLNDSVGQLEPSPELLDNPSDEEKTVLKKKSSNKGRVGFSDTLEFIPRPLSLVSSDTSSTMTARPMHSVSGSISSVVSPTSPTDRDAIPTVTRSPTRDFNDHRPGTAGAILDRTSSIAETADTSPRRRNSIPALIGLAEAQEAAAGSANQTKPSKRWSFFGLEPFLNSSTASKVRPTSSSSTDSGNSSEDDSEADAIDGSRSKPKKRSRKSKVKKGMKGWAGSILPIKPRHDKKRAKPGDVRPPTPPAPAMVMDEDEDEETATTPVLLTPTIVLPPAEPPKKAREDIASPMIDLDAALGPFNTPLPHNPEWEAAQRAAGNVGKRRLHSAQGLKGFNGPGMHYHRRAESAPDLPPFDAGRAGIHRFGSSSTMADVFEEDEEDEGRHDTQHDKSPGSKSDSDPETSPSLPSLSSRTSLAESTSRQVRRTGSGLSEKDLNVARSVRTECSRTSLHENVIMEEPIWGNPSARSPSLAQGRSSFDSSMPSPKKLLASFEGSDGRMSTSNSPTVASVSTMPMSPYSMSHASSHPSPRSPMSIDAQRISTAPSSVADETSFQSLLMGEPGPEVRISMDYDIPSLSSSTTTMTRESAFVPTARPYQAALREQRPASMSSAAFGRRRSSLISLSRLISSSHGERSKLSTELTADGDVEPRLTKKPKKTRLGKMMQFWKPNKSDSATGHART
ncbi:hypothetical protein VHEMI10562 [[Torrubiella] hemipterigena]|uniref:Cell wall proline rich protein n=1 Tax=[Torrubiella] hemipterigena TaxID=1531966 RepID=A0A0A1TJ01_9HYPO|nr:hypothetical protein VHEMI10562 [[Torrubiella] hemipterigena]